jgi:hypothetical protein
MKCIDPWLLNNRRQCPVCKRYVFPNQDHSDEEETNDRQQTRTATEQTPLMNPNDNNSGTDISRNRQLPGKIFHHQIDKNKEFVSLFRTSIS